MHLFSDATYIFSFLVFTEPPLSRDAHIFTQKGKFDMGYLPQIREGFGGLRLGTDAASGNIRQERSGSAQARGGLKEFKWTCHRQTRASYFQN